MIRQGRGVRLDQWLVEHGQCESQEKALRSILAGEIWIGGHRADKPGQLIPPDTVVERRTHDRYVSRGGHKLAAALREFQIAVEGTRCLDVGSSTGGFTDCLLQHGASHVTALDVGRGQLDWKLRQDPRVTVREGINARLLQAADLEGNYSLVVIDVSFISLKAVLPALWNFITPEGSVIALVKPQFEAPREEVGPGGVINDAAVHQKVTGSLIDWLARSHPEWKTGGLLPSPITGREGNVEFLWWIRRTNATPTSLPSSNP